MKLLALMLLVVLMAREYCEGFVGTALPTRAAAAATRRHKGAVNMANVVVEFTNSKKTVNAVVGSPLSQLCAKNGIKVKYSCKQGDCATCSINIDGRNVKACQGRVPASRRIVKIKA
ncbi:unnamed protein product [Ectocarpus sp. CCAP 1310/34]|nr:unnamed protein product [Ectocarpus sp. CCAP 1310/34]